MEPTDKSEENAAMPANPKPSDDVQLNIETVTPDTEKEVVPTANVNKGDEEDQSEQDLAQPESDQPIEESAGDKDEKPDDKDDTRDQVETVSP